MSIGRQGGPFSDRLPSWPYRPHPFGCAEGV